MAIVSGKGITKLLAKKKMKNAMNDQKDNKKSTHEKSKVFFQTNSGKSRVKRTLKIELLFLVLIYSIVPMVITSVLTYFDNTLLGNILIIGSATVIVVLSSIFVAKRIAKPITQMTETIKAISRGELGTVALPSGNLELTRLALSINQMSIVLKDHHDELQKTKQKFRELYENSPDLFRTVDKHGIILGCNKSYAEKLGYTKREIIGKSLFDHVPEQNLEAMKDSFETWRKAGIVSNREIWLKRKDGTTFPTLLNAKALYDGEGNILGSVTVLRDMSEIYKVKNEVLEQKEKRLLAIGELSARISHDLRNPLSVIKTSVALLRFRLESADEKTQGDLVRIERAISRMTHQIDEVLDYVTPKPLNIQNTSLLKVLSSALERLSVPDTVTINLPKEDVNVTCDPEKIEVVFANLLTNAIQVMRNAGSIHIRARSEDEKTVIEVEDNGPGINDYVLTRLFDPLFTTRQTGTGLGLVSCKRIVEKHGGTIEAKNGSIQGAIFVITIPKTD
jgi:PAS domain S-box-containing protein